MIKVVLAGTPEFSVPIFEEVIKNFDVVAIVSQPDKPANRGYKLIATPTKLLAEKYNIKCYQPNKISEIYEELNKLEFDFLLTAAFGQYIPEKILNLPKKAALNIHGSLLPKYRGAAPIQHSLLNGDKKTGINLIYMVKEMDAGNILKSAEINIEENDTSDTLFNKLSILSAKNITQWLVEVFEGKFTELVQDTSQVILAPKLTKDEAEINPNNTAKQVINKIKAYSSNPGAFTFINDKRVKLFNASINPIKNAIEIKCIDKSIYVYDYQYESKKRVNLIKK
ncbi:methionyl-tRNA formyltransferase [Mycoplasmopsis anatis]|uniref:Methionyl-tRNA formyltransferase n=1 Tax=Mycoplasmopsis anatis TaxID=171279 RepID=A0A9Q3QDD9_9BACT|nr:methionyl-tRNA formyltransferase [Mycoplasmopsis anatis]MBW0594522.1 methionyl-tRNA formyltransferase [Mycoplasmopsis anatis]MBW0595297.1 methionyl-tRNA formyltransferase [Mycoplasmopsis anatis]MBW0596129.1 methionyl-tRNA formyltransferase [Mycoplasmopsis anatis]MBW0596813.1 methionyl-tRNA formyltransferase [Mycoplasmopsis anatis]MBW0597764.1 methionyl-tRNA formyltransferase [Mycoplasmopsis anatis]